MDLIFWFFSQASSRPRSVGSLILSQNRVDTSTEGQDSFHHKPPWLCKIIAVVRHAIDWLGIPDLDNLSGSIQIQIRIASEFPRSWIMIVPLTQLWPTPTWIRSWSDLNLNSYVDSCMVQSQLLLGFMPIF